MINKKIALSLLSIAAALTVTGGAAYAAFSSEATSNNNIFSSGSLVLSFNDETNVQTATGQFSGTDLVPGSCTGNQTVNLYNNGTVNGSSFVIDVSNSNALLSPFLRINNLTMDGTPIVVANSNATGFIDLADLEAGATTIGIPAGSSRNLVMDVCLDASAGNAQQGQTSDSSFTYTLNQ